jgi:hypothetical protein
VAYTRKDILSLHKCFTAVAVEPQVLGEDVTLRLGMAPAVISRPSMNPGLFRNLVCSVEKFRCQKEYGCMSLADWMHISARQWVLKIDAHFRHGRLVILIT